ncbi:thiolase family protein [Rhodococcoides fascians]|uniref:thiolase family protein n=1 Tax=Rhodococcoides fascians TaxID=1828 RepID=UPI000566F1AB|nr:thiolase family protein [Rhodococcus fascians]
MSDVAVVGIGATEFTRRSGVSVASLVATSGARALVDAGLTARDVDGVVPVGGGVFVEDLIAGLGLADDVIDAFPPPGGNSALTGLELGRNLLRSGAATTVLVVFGRNGSSSTRIANRVATLPGQDLREQLERTAGWSTPAQWYAMMCRRHMADFGTCKDDMAEVALAARHHAGLNPAAQLHAKTLTADDYHAARMIADPYQRWDCCLETDGSVAVLLTTADRAAGNPRAVPLLGVASSRPDSADDLTNRSDWHSIGLTTAAPRAFEEASVGPTEVAAAMIYDCFTFEVLHQLEEAGFCERGGSGAFVRDGGIRLGGRLPVNTHGGLLAEGHLAGLSHVLEAVRQVRGEAGDRQVDGRIIAVTGWGDLGDGSLAVLGH